MGLCAPATTVTLTTSGLLISRVVSTVATVFVCTGVIILAYVVEGTLFLVPLY